MKKIIIIIFIIIIIIPNDLFSQRTNRNKKSRGNVEKFILAPFAEAISMDSVKIVTYIEIPYKSLQFIKSNNVFLGSYQASIGIRDKKGQELDHVSWTDSIKVDNYIGTKSYIRNKKHFCVFKVPIGVSYEVIGELQDLDTRKKGILNKSISLKELNKKPALLKPNFMLDLPGDWGFENGKIPTSGFRVREIGDGVELKISGFVNEGDYNVNIYLTNMISSDSLIQKFSGDGISGYFSEMIFIPSSKFKSIKNDFRIELKQNKKVDETIVSFSKFKSGISSYIYDIELAIDQMQYIISEEERISLKNIKQNKREEYFYTLWKNRDPSPNTDYNELMEEYFKRVDYANEHFTGWEPGWETDRGMIYILFGPPEEIQRTNPSSRTPSTYQIWNYFTISKRFVFVDQSGFGDFQLESPFIDGGI